MKDVDSYKDVITYANPLKLAPDSIVRTGCLISVCKQGEIQKYCDQECTNSCEDSQIAQFNVHNCTWECRTDLACNFDLCTNGMSTHHIKVTIKMFSMSNWNAT